MFAIAYKLNAYFITGAVLGNLLLQLRRTIYRVPVYFGDYVLILQTGFLMTER